MVNGWTNRETWLVELYFGDTIREDLQEKINYEEIDKDTTMLYLANHVEAFMSSYLDDELENVTNGFLKDMIDLSAIDYIDLVETYSADLEWLDNGCNE